ncbi:topoisomerase ii-associated protein pat1 [Ophiostoma piceae UAMH 11346]|uniref:Topoisomerase ii-associated protein pat1 n=1 Tax=Ophiostoma piceae (strain UAMH 11346) TaxID=1262450 RepID=S3C585_OPHP1|nr:topoisomerase ii-associated protein pat1 [Ophiostoma piceae UAMH 11346]
MAFFGFDPSRHNTAAPGFSQANDPFAGLSGGNPVDNALEFEDTYDGLGDQLVETGDAFNDDTFGDASGAGGVGGGIGGSAFGPSKVGKDFDYFKQTAQVADAIDQEHMRFNLLQPATRGAPIRHDYNQGPPASSQHYGFFAPEPVASRPVRTGYEKYNEPEAELTVDAALWGVAPKKPAASTAAAAPMSATPVQAAIAGPSASRKILSLEEVEAAMRAKKTPASQQQPQVPHGYPQQIPEQYQQPPLDYSYGMPPPEMMGVPPQFQNLAPQMSILQRPTSQQTPPGFPPIPSHLQQQQQQQQQQPQPNQEAASNRPTQILQNPNRQPAAGEMAQFGGITLPFPGQQPPAHQRQDSSFGGAPHIITHPSQVQGLTEEEKVVYMEQEAKRAKRNHKIFLLSKNNGLMTPQDKNFVTRIQLQQLVSATGNPNDHGTDEALKEDFYYQVLSQIRGSSRQHPNQPLNNFAQTYLFQTGSRMHSRRYMNRDRGAETHVQRMEQQVQRAVEAAKNRPKNKQLVIEGTLGKISFSNAKTPKPLLNIKRSENPASPASPSAAAAAAAASAYGTASSSTAAKTLDRKTVLSSIEKVYATLMEIEDQDRKMPPPATSSEDLELIQRHVEWADNSKHLAAKLWRYLKVHEQIGAYTVHPFIALLSFPKGMQAIPRVFRNLSREQRTTVLTMIIVHLDQLDIVRNAQANSGLPVTAAMRENIDRFSMTVNSTLFTFMNELDLDLVTGVLGLITSCKVDVIAKSRIGASVMTMVLSRAEEIKQANGGTPEHRLSWENAYNEFFNKIEPTLPYMFPGTVFVDEDIYVWQFLAAMGICATPDQHSRLVISVKDRVMDTVAAAKTLPVDLATQRKQSVNLFMRSIGLDVELLQ